MTEWRNYLAINSIEAQRIEQLLEEYFVDQSTRWWDNGVDKVSLIDDRQWMYDLDQQMEAIFLAYPSLWALKETTNMKLALFVVMEWSVW